MADERRLHPDGVHNIWTLFSKVKVDLFIKLTLEDDQNSEADVLAYAPWPEWLLNSLLLYVSTFKEGETGAIDSNPTAPDHQLATLVEIM